MAEVLEINDLEDLAGYRLLWNALLQRTPQASFFQSLDWLETYWRHFGAGQQLRVLVVSVAGEPVGILPLTVRGESTRVGAARVLTYPLHDWGSFYGPIGPHSTATLLAGLGHVARTRRDWDLLDLRWTAAALDRTRTPRSMLARGFTPVSGIWGHSAQVELAGGWDQYLASRKKSWRQAIKDAEKRLGKRGEISLLRYRPRGASWGDADPRWDLYDACEDLARRSWQGSSTTGTTLSHESVRPFLREAHVAAARAGAADINLLLVAGKPVAFSYNYHLAGYVYGLRMGYDAEVAREGAGTVLLARSLRDSCERGDRIFDLGSEYLECKLNWLTRLAESERHTFYRGTAKAQALRWKRWLAGLRRRAG